MSEWTEETVAALVDQVVATIARELAEAPLIAHIGVGEQLVNRALVQVVDNGHPDLAIAILDNLINVAASFRGAIAEFTNAQKAKGESSSSEFAIATA